MKRLIPILALLCAFAAPSFAQTNAPVPALMNFQGRLAKPDGTPVPDTNTQTLTFSLYDALLGGNLLWTQQQSNIAVHNGVFATRLVFTIGFLNGNTLTSTFASPLITPYLQIQVGTNAPLSPRQVFTSTAYSLVASTALSVPQGSLTPANFAGGVLVPGGSAGGDLMGTYPNPLLITNPGLLPKVPGGVMSAAQNANAVVDQSQPIASNLSVGKQSLWQSFTPSQTQPITGIDLYLANSNDLNSTITFALYLGEGVGGTLLYSTSLPYLGNFSIQHFSLPGTPPTLQANALYTFQVTETGGQNFYVGLGLNNPYPSGDSSVSASDDLYFQTYARLVNDVTLRGSLTVMGSATGSASDIPLQVIGSNSLPHLRVASTAAAPYGAYLSLDATANTGGKNWLVYSTGNTAGEGQGKFCLQNSTNGVFPFAILPTGQVGINTTSPNTAYALDVNGIVHASSFSTASDARFKTNIQPLDHALEDVLNLRGVSYEMDRAKWAGKRDFPEGRQIGFIAQEVEKIFPELVLTDSEGYKSVLYQNAVPILVEAIKAQEKRIKALEDANAELKKQNAAIAELAREIAEMKKEKRP